MVAQEPTTLGAVSCKLIMGMFTGAVNPHHRVRVNEVKTSAEYQALAYPLSRHCCLLSVNRLTRSSRDKGTRKQAQRQGVTVQAVPSLSLLSLSLFLFLIRVSHVGCVYVCCPCVPLDFWRLHLRRTYRPMAPHSHSSLPCHLPT